MTRVAVSIDYQNCYMGARHSFSGLRQSFTGGQVHPRRLALRLVGLGRRIDEGRELTSAMVFRGMPSALHNPRGQMACRRQIDHWNAQPQVEGVARPLRYSPIEFDDSGKPSNWVAREKGIDVLLALAMVMGAVRDQYDVAVLMSRDTDLVPAIEQVLALGKRCEVAAWKGENAGNARLRVVDRTLWCHWLDEDEYASVADPTDYTIPRALESG